MTCKPWLDALRRKMIVNPIQIDSRTRPDQPLGHSMDWIFRYAIGGGQADFDVPIGDLLPADRALLYAYLNQRNHILELIEAFSQVLAPPSAFNNATIIDIGCGPFTSGLALANVLGTGVDFRYVGIDHAASMHALGTLLAEGARAAGEISAGSTVRFMRTLTDFDPGQRRSHEPVIFVLSYLLASRSLDVDRLGREIATLRARVTLGPAIVLYTNSTRPEARASFPRFKEVLLAEGFDVHVDEEGTVDSAARERRLHYALFSSPSVSLLATSEFPG